MNSMEDFEAYLVVHFSDRNCHNYDVADFKELVKFMPYNEVFKMANMTRLTDFIHQMRSGDLLANLSLNCLLNGIV